MDCLVNAWKHMGDTHHKWISIMINENIKNGKQKGMNKFSG